VYKMKKLFILSCRFQLIAGISAGLLGSALGQKAPGQDSKPAHKPVTETFQPNRARTKRLPPEALKSATEAEQKLKAGQPMEALAVLTRIDRDHPGHAAISLRMGQIFDTMNKTGQALFYYRRYVQYSGDRPREEAVARITALELTPNAKQSAEAFATTLGEKSIAMQTPAPRTTTEMAAEREDGSLVPIKDNKELERYAKEGLPLAPPEPISAAPTPFVVNMNNSQSGQAMSANRKSQNSGGMFGNSRATGNSGQENGSISDNAMVSPSGSQRLPAKVITTKPALKSADEDAQLVAKFVGPPASNKDATNGSAPSSSASIPPRSSLPSNVAIIQPASQVDDNDVPSLQNAGMPVSSPSGTTPLSGLPKGTPADRPPIRSPQRQAEQVVYTSPTPATKVESIRAENFFTLKASGGTSAEIRLVNQVPNSIISFKALPIEQGETVSAILAQEENRTLQMSPGSYDLTVSISTTNYPPQSLMEAHFTATFAAGTQYTRWFHPDNLQQVR
jgi:hypothetical protein